MSLSIILLNDKKPPRVPGCFPAVYCAATFHDMIGAGYRSLQEQHDAFWGARYAIIEDPDGIAVGLMSPASPGRKAPPPNL